MLAHSPTAVPSVAVVGAGAAGVLTALHLLDALPRGCGPHRVELLDPSPTTGRGAAYSTPDAQHLLNVRAGGMSAYPQRPDHFVDWARSADPSVRGEHFLPRRLFGDYLEHCLTTARARRPDVEVVRRACTVLDAAPAVGGVELHTTTGRTRADVVVLALGTPARGTPSWAERTGAAALPELVPDPWAPQALQAVPASGDVLLVGAGLSMVDLAVALGRPGRTVHVVSRSGRLPRAHRVDPSRRLPPLPRPSPGMTLEDAEHLVAQTLATAARGSGDWRAGVDALRPVTDALWSALSEDDQARWLRTGLRAWETLRHRTAPATAAAFAALRAAGHVDARAASVRAVGRSAEGTARVHLTDGRVLEVVSLVDCTGPAHRMRSTSTDLLDRLCLTGTARPGPHRLGLDVDDEGRLLTASGAPADRLLAVGALRRGRLWETTAVPEIRTQAARAARAAVELLPGRRADAAGAPQWAGAGVSAVGLRHQGVHRAGDR